MRASALFHSQAWTADESTVDESTVDERMVDELSLDWRLATAGPIYCTVCIFCALPALPFFSSKTISRLAVFLVGLLAGCA